MYFILHITRNISSFALISKECKYSSKSEINSNGPNSIDTVQGIKSKSGGFYANGYYTTHYTTRIFLPPTSKVVLLSTILGQTINN